MVAQVIDFYEMTIIFAVKLPKTHENCSKKKVNMRTR